MLDLKNETVVITGAAGGFGAELVKLFCHKGARIIALDLSAPALKKLKSVLEGSGFDITTRVCDVTKPGHFDDLSRTLEKSGMAPIVWINNAGISYPEAFSQSPAERFQKVMDVNLNGVIYGTRTALKLMQKYGRGTIVNVASASGHLPSPFLVSYSTAKHGVVGFTRSLQLELYQQASPVKLCLVSPGFADTAIMKTNAEFKVPKILKWSVGTAKSVAKEIVTAVIKGKDEIYPGLSGTAMLALYKYTPKSIFRFTSRFFTARNFKEMIGLEGIRTR